MSTPLMSRVLHYRDESGRLREVRVESADPAELERVERLYRRMERRSDEGEKRFRNGHATFTDLGVDPGSVVAAPAVPKSKGGYPWEGPRFSFALLLGESPSWAGPESTWLWVWDGQEWTKRCRFCGHYRELPIMAYCLGCDQSGRDRAIPRGAYRTRVRKPKDDKLKGGKS